MLIRAANFGIILHIVSCDIRITTDFTRKQFYNFAAKTLMNV